MERTDWWRGGIIYEIYPRSFADANNDGVGDLFGITQKLDYVARLGAEAIWITPFFRSPMADFGYDVADYRAVDPIFGNDEDFDQLVEKAHTLGLKVLIDYVISHTSDQHGWFTESRASRDNPKADWYVWADRKPDGSPPNNWLSVFGGPAWQWDTRRRQYYLHNFLTSQPDLNVHNPDVQAAILGEMRFWLDRGVDGFRLDALNFSMHDRQLRNNPPALDPALSEQPMSNPYAYQQHIYDKSQPELPEFLERIRALLDEYGATSLAEVGDDRGTTLKLMADYSGTEGRIHQCYGFDFLGPTFAPKFIADVLGRYAEGAPNSWPCWAFSNHDCMRQASRLAKPGQDRAIIARLAAALLLSLRGSICLYQGEELGLPEADLALEDLQDPAGKAFWPEYKGRDGCRTPFPWSSDAVNAGFGSAKPWLPVSPEHIPLAVDRQDGVAGSLLEFYREAIRMRQETDALRIGAMEIVEVTDQRLVLERRAGNVTVRCAFNFSAEPQAIEVPAGAQVLLGDVSEGHLTAFGFVWLTLD